MVDVGIVGATGYAGEELIDILLRHPHVRITDVSAKIEKPITIAQLFPRFSKRIDLTCFEPDIQKICAHCDVVFLALPHTVSMEFVPQLLKKGKRVIDLSADYRLKDAKVYSEFYKVRHVDEGHIAQAVYGLPELYRNKIKGASLIANPGCYPTASILGVAPLVALEMVDSASIIIDAKSGVTGAGRKASVDFCFPELNEDCKAYKINNHQHMPEINQELSGLAGEKVNVTFVPHLLSVNRGILATIYAKKNKKSSLKGQNARTAYQKFYKNEPFVRIKDEGDFPRLKDVVKTNFCDIGIKEEKEQIIVVAAIDNLLKGASGQAVENFNIMYSFPEQTGLL